jgi:hypothetical protein
MDKKSFDEAFLNDLDSLPYEYISVRKISENEIEVFLDLHEKAINGAVLRDLDTISTVHRASLSMEKGRFVFR